MFCFQSSLVWMCFSSFVLYKWQITNYRFSFDDCSEARGNRCVQLKILFFSSVTFFSNNFCFSFIILYFAKLFCKAVYFCSSVSFKLEFQAFLLSSNKQEVILKNRLSSGSEVSKLFSAGVTLYILHIFTSWRKKNQFCKWMNEMSINEYISLGSCL